MTMAILGGDSLINMGASAITAAGLDPDIAAACHHLYQQGFQDLVDGVLLEMNMVTEPSTTPETYLRMIRMKTAALFERALMMGATIARGTQSQLDALQEFGIRVGQAFQVQDDILGSFGDEARTGKSASGDIREGKRTMLVIEAYARGSQEKRAVLDSLLGRPDMSEEDVEQVRSVFVDTGALKACHQHAERLLRTGQQALDRASPPLVSQYRDLVDLSEFLVNRDY